MKKYGEFLMFLFLSLIFIGFDSQYLAEESEVPEDLIGRPEPTECEGPYERYQKALGRDRGLMQHKELGEPNPGITA